MYALTCGTAFVSVFKLMSSFDKNAQVFGVTLVLVDLGTAFCFDNYLLVLNFNPHILENHSILTPALLVSLSCSDESSIFPNTQAGLFDLKTHI